MSLYIAYQLLGPFTIFTWREGGRESASGGRRQRIQNLMGRQTPRCTFLQDWRTSRRE